MGRRLARLALALLVPCALASCAYYNTFYLARKYYFKATDGAPYEVDRDGTTQRSNYAKSGDYSKKLLGVYPRSKWVDDAWLLWARTLIGTDDPLKAVAMLEEFQTRFPKSELRPDAEFFLGLAYRAARKHEKAVASFDEFLAQSPKHVLAPYAYYERSKALMSLQRYADAAASAGEILKRYPGHALVDKALRQRAEARFQQQEWAGAREDFKSIGERATTDDERLRFLLREVDCLEANRDYDQARTLLRDARAHVEPPPPQPTATSTGLVSQPGAPPPPPIYTAATPIQERYGRLTLRMGGVELLDGHVKEAIEFYQTVLHDYPRTQLAAEAQFRIGFAYETGADDFERARVEYAKVNAQTGTSQFSQQAQQRLDNLERIERFRTAVGADSSARQAEARFLTAEHYLFNLDRPERALEEYRAIVDSTSAPAVKARALNAEAWVLSRKLHRKTSADSLFWAVVRGYPATEAQLAARDYLEADGEPVPENLIVAPKEPVKPVLDDTAELTKPPAGTPPLGSRPGPIDPNAVIFGPGGNSTPSITPTSPSWRLQHPDSLRRAMTLRDSLMRAARQDTSLAGRARLDSLARGFMRADTVGRGAKMAEIQRQLPRPQGVVVAPDSTAPRLAAADSSARRASSRRSKGLFAPVYGPVIAGRIIEADPAGAGTTPADSARAARDSTRRAAADSEARLGSTSPLGRRIPPDSAASRPDTTRGTPAQHAPAGGRVEPPKPKVSTGDFSSVWHRTTKAERDSLRRVRAEEDSVRRAEKAAAKARKHQKAPPDTSAQGKK